MITLGSLFDGIGGFPLAGTMCGITPVWSSEIEPFPLKVTAARFPNMKQLGSVTDIDGAKVEPVDIITFGSPCQDLSIAGKQLGIHDGKRSNLFFEAIRIIKEMRDADTANGRSGFDIRPRFAVWENVPGAFSSNGGEDFRAVLEAFASVCQDGLHIPRPKKWNHAGSVVGDGWSVAWRVYDAQYWGVPQRRKRIYLVADFASERAGEILFEREGLCGDIAQGGKARERTAADAERSVGRSGDVRCLNPWDSKTIRQYDVNGVAPTINANSHGGQNRWGVCYPTIARALTARHDSSPCVDRGQNVVALDCRNMVGNNELSATIQAKSNGGQSLNYINPIVYSPTSFGKYSEQQPTLRASGGDNGPGSEGLIVYPKVTGALYANSHPGSYTGQDAFNDMLPVVPSSKPPRKYIVRRLTPIECARLQGMPDWWCEGLDGSDSAIYKAYGNGLALPCAYDVLRRIAKEMEA